MFIIILKIIISFLAVVAVTFDRQIYRGKLHITRDQIFCSCYVSMFQFDRSISDRTKISLSAWPTVLASFQLTSPCQSKLEPFTFKVNYLKTF